MTQWSAAVALAVPRILGLFLIVPIFGQGVIPSMARNSMYIALALIVVPMIAVQQPLDQVEAAQWVLVLVKELAIGAIIGFLFAAIFWAMDVAGGIVDMQSGAGFATVSDPFQGVQTTLTSQWLVRLAISLLFASGGFLVLLDLLFRSYIMWPVLEYYPSFERIGIALMIDQFGFVMTQGLLMAAPVMLMLSMVDIGMGLVNRYAQQMNVLQFSLAVKFWLRTWGMFLILGIIVEVLLSALKDSQGLLDKMAEAL